jgi:uncharacterized repeat protein (TIGR03803 family)
MTRWTLSECALSLSIAGALLAACGGSQPPIGASGAVPRTTSLAAHTGSTNYKVVYSFGGGSDGASPSGGLVDVGGTLYGTTSAGGSYSSCDYYQRSGCGTVFTVTLTGTEKVLYSFANAPDGASPNAPLIEVNGTLYGTTYFGGSRSCYGSIYANCGTVFSITPSGTEEVLHSFSGGPSDGAYPLGELIDVSGTLYGTTNEGGDFFTRHGYAARGTVFSVTTTGTEKVVISFGSNHNGAYPEAGLIYVGGKLYGTTKSGGRHGFGTVFSVTPGGTEKVLHSFGSGTDGADPVATLIELKGRLYGTTTAGGSYGEGTVFRITPGGTEKVLHSFGNGTDGAHPLGPLTELKGTFYGTTRAGGAYSCSYGGCGTVFSMTPDGRESVLYSFQGPQASDGDWPASKLLKLDNALYGTTVFGGTHNTGTIFSLKP